ncbi:MAG: hypothetical protein V9H69_01465 [Anaerolineae bacterium]
MPTTAPRSALLRLLPYLLLAAILALAAALRCYRLGAVSFTFDAAAVSNLAAQWIDQGRLPLQGMVSSTGFRNPPLTVYLISLPLRFSRDPLALTGFVVALNLLAVAGTFWLGQRYWSKAAGLLAALLFAVSPWAVQHSRGVLGQDLLAPGVVLLMICTLAWFVEGRRWMLAAALATLAALIQIHLAAIALAPLLALLVLWELISQRRQGAWSRLWQPLALGVALGALLYLPYLIADAQQGWTNVRGFLGQGSSAAGVQGQVFDLALLNIGGRNIHALAGPQRYRDFLAGLPASGYWPDRLEELLVLAAALFLGARLLRRRYDARQARSNGVLLLWLATPVLFFLLFNAQVQLHYLVVLYPVPYLALGAAAVELHSLLAGRIKLRRGLAAAGGVALLLLVAWQIMLVNSIYRFIDLHDTPDGWPTPARIVRDAAQTLGQVRQPPPRRPGDRALPGPGAGVGRVPGRLDLPHQPTAQRPRAGLRRSRLPRLPGGRGGALLADAGRQPGRGRAAFAGPGAAGGRCAAARAGGRLSFLPHPQPLRRHRPLSGGHGPAGRRHPAGRAGSARRAGALLRRRSGRLRAAGAGARRHRAPA